MKKLPAALALLYGVFAIGPVFAQCVSPCGVAGGSYGSGAADIRTAADFEKQCVDALAKHGSAVLKAKIANDKALNQTARNNAGITDQQIESNAQCHSVCKQYGEDRFEWGHYVSAGVAYTSEPAMSLQKKWGGKPEPVMPGDAQFNACFGQAKFDNWCPPVAQSGPLNDIGNGPTRLTNYIDGLPVCVQPGAGFTILNFTADQLKQKSLCSKTSIVDALDRFTQETKCLAQVAITFAHPAPVNNNPAIIRKP